MTIDRWECMEMLECLFLRHMRPVTGHAQHPLRFGYLDGVGVDNAVLYFLHRANSPTPIWRSQGVRSESCSLILRRLACIGPSSIAWISDKMIARPQTVRAESCHCGVCDN